MRFAWEKKHTDFDSSVQAGCGTQLIRQVYNALWWLPILLVVINKIDFSTGFITFTVVSLIRFVANLYLNNVLTVEQAEVFPFRA